MKVTTDACLFGAWVPAPEGPIRILDVGAGTGLLSLMLAQRSPEAVIDAVELDTGAAEQAAENVRTSPFINRITVSQSDARMWMTDEKYDLIVSNPPFFSASLQSDNTRRMDVRHSNTLAMDDLLALAGKFLKEEGSLAVLWPFEAYSHWASAASTQGYRELHRLDVFPSAISRQTRVAALWQRAAEVDAPPASRETLFIEEERGRYTTRFTRLLAPFYLRLSVLTSSAK